VHVPPVAFLRAQLDALFADFRIGVVKLGMLANSEVIHTVADALERYRQEGHAPPVVLDPVMVATSGARLLDPDALHALRSRLLPLSALITPNIPEAEYLLGHAVPDARAAEEALGELQALGARAVLLKGGHLPGPGPVTDRLADTEGRTQWVHPRLALEGHGTGCTLASAIAARMALGDSLRAACEAATAYVHGALLNASRPGLGSPSVLGHFWEARVPRR
jgi:hydroxymethylpyrimidine/phosphomethylpyrimidine kinase